MAGAFVWVMVLILFLVGIIGTLVPAVPGVGLIWLGIAVYAVATHFEEVGLSGLIALGALSLLASAASYAGGILAAKAAGSRRWAVIGAGVGAVLGLMLGNVVGLLVGGFAGAFLGAAWESRQAGMAVRAATITVVGILMGTVLQFLVGVSMITGFFFEIWVGG